MKLSGTRTIREEVEVSPSELHAAYIKLMMSGFDWKEGYFVRGEKVFLSEEQHTSHSYFVEKEVREATSTDLKFAEALASLRELWSIRGASTLSR